MYGSAKALNLEIWLPGLNDRGHMSSLGPGYPRLQILVKSTSDVGVWFFKFDCTPLPALVPKPKSGNRLALVGESCSRDFEQRRSPDVDG